MKGRIAQRSWYDRLPQIVERAMNEWTGLTGRPYGLIAPYRTEDADYIMVSMGTMADTALAVVDAYRSEGRKVGCITVTSFRTLPATSWPQLFATPGRGGWSSGPTSPRRRTIRSPARSSRPSPMRRWTGAPLPRVVSVSAGLAPETSSPATLGPSSTSWPTRSA